MKNLSISIIIPCYNEQESIKKTYKELNKILLKNNFNHELIFINDGSKDNTLKILEDISAKDPAVKIINFSRNFGHQPAVSAGIANCAGDYAVIIDADLQDPPSVIPEMVNLAREKAYNVVYGVRRKRKGEGILKKLTAKIYYRLINYLSSIRIPVDTGDFRLIDKKVINAFNSLNEKDKYIRGLITWLGFKQTPIFYDRDPRFAGSTKYSVRKMFKFALTGLLSFSNKPLKLALTLGFFSIIIALLSTVYVFVSKIFWPARTIPGWTSTLIIIIYFGGVQLLTTGVLGEYIGRIFDEVKSRPEYIIDKKINFK